MKTLARYVKTASTAQNSIDRLSRRSLFLFALLLCLATPFTNSAEVLYFCSAANPVASGPWSIDIDVNGAPDLTVAVVGQNVTVLPAIGNSVLATNRSYYTNIPSFNEPVLVAFPDEVASLASGAVVSFFNPTRPFWRERREGNEQPLTLPMTFPPDGSELVATNYFAVKLRVDGGWILSWIRVRLTSGPDATYAVDWAYETRPTPRLADKIVAGSRPSPSTIRSVEKILGIPLNEDVGIDLDANGTTDIYLGGTALTTFGGGGIIGIGGGTIPPPSATFSYGLTMADQNEVLRDNQNAWILQTGGGIANFVPPGTLWTEGSAGLASTSLGTNSNWIGHLAEATNGYMGIRIFKDNEFYYGWIQLQLSNQMIGGYFGPSILGWAIETRPQVPIVAGDRGVTGEAVLASPSLIGNLTVVNVSGLSRSNVILSSSDDLIHWTPLITNSVPFRFVSATSALGNQQYFRATIDN